MNTQISERLVRSGKVLNVIGIVLAVLCFIAAALALIGAIVVAALPEDLIRQIPNLPFVDATSSYIITTPLNAEGTISWDAESMVPFDIAFLALKVSFIIALGLLCLFFLINAIILLILTAIFKSTAVNKTPFTYENAKRLKIIGIILIIATIPLGWGNLIFAFCVFAFAYVVQYGAELQQQADETL